MRKSIKIAVSVCLALGLLFLALWIYAGTLGEASRTLQESAAEYNRAIAQVKAAEVLGKETADITIPEEVILTPQQNRLIRFHEMKGFFLIIGIDLLVVAAGAALLALYRKRQRGKGQELRKVTSGNNILGILIAFIVLCFNLALASDAFLTMNNFLNVFQQISINFVVAVGMTYVIISGGIDLSVGSNIALSGLLMAIMMKFWGLSVPATILLGIHFSVLIGALNGVLITYLNLPPFIATLGMMYLARGAAYTVTGGQPLYTFPKGFTEVSSRVAGIPLYGILIMLAILFIGWYGLKYTRPGRFTFAVGGNEDCARLSGIDVNRTKVFVYAFSGFCCGVAALLLASRLDSAVPTNADGQEMDAIAAVVIGGTSMKGGEGSMLGTVIGILIIGVISNGLNLLGVAQRPQKLIKGALIVIAVIIDVMRRRSAESAT